MGVACPMITLSLPSPFSNGNEGTWLVLCPAHQAVERKQQPAGTLYTLLPLPLHLHPILHVLELPSPGRTPLSERKSVCMRNTGKGVGELERGPQMTKATPWCGWK